MSEYKKMGFISIRNKQESILLHGEKEGNFRGSCLLANVKGNVFVFDHMHDLMLHCEDKENDPIAEQDGPENRDIEHR